VFKKESSFCYGGVGGFLLCMAMSGEGAVEPLGEAAGLVKMPSANAGLRQNSSAARRHLSPHGTFAGGRQRIREPGFLQGK